MKLKSILCTLLLVSATGCASVNVRTDSAPETVKPPTYEQSFEFWWWGTKGEHEVNVREVCLGKGVEQMQTVNTFSDSFVSIITLGIYYKRTARVWCKE